MNETEKRVRRTAEIIESCLLTDGKYLPGPLPFPDPLIRAELFQQNSFRANLDFRYCLFQNGATARHAWNIALQRGVYRFCGGDAFNRAINWHEYILRVNPYL